MRDAHDRTDAMFRRWSGLLGALAAHDRAWPDNDDDRGPWPPPDDRDSDGLPAGGVDPYDREGQK